MPFIDRFIPYVNNMNNQTFDRDLFFNWNMFYATRYRDI